MSWTGEAVPLFVGDDWAEDHHDVELMDAAGRMRAAGSLGDVLVQDRQGHIAEQLTCVSEDRLHQKTHAF